MAVEIERKFLVLGDDWRKLIKRTESLKQGYLANDNGVNVRVRLIDDSQAFLTIKAALSGMSRSEFEYEIPAADARQLLALSGARQVEKVRHSLALDGGDWVVDEFGGRHHGLILAEVELESEDTPVDPADWLGDEVTHDLKYYSSSLAEAPSVGEM
jgi:adenylate cyclase